MSTAPRRWMADRWWTRCGGWPTGRWRAEGCSTCRSRCRCAPRAIAPAGTCPGGTCGTGPTRRTRYTWARSAAATPSNCEPGGPAPAPPGTGSARTRTSCRSCRGGSPAWPPPAPAPATITGHSGPHAQARLAGIIGRLLAARRGERNRLLFWASLRAGELVADGDLDAGTTAHALTGAATQIGLAGEDGPQAVAATIRSGFHRAGTTV